MLGRTPPGVRVKGRKTMLDEQNRKDLEGLCEWIFQTEAEDFVEQLCEQYPDDADYIRECLQEGNWESIDKYAWNNPDKPGHVYALATRLWVNLLKENVQPGKEK
jgi:hypothetical protein